MGTCVVVVVQQAAGAVVWRACTSSLKDLGQPNDDVPVGVGYLPLLEWDRGHMTGFGEEDRNHLFGCASQSLEFHAWLSSGKSPTEDCFFVSGSYWDTSLVTRNSVPDLL